MRAYQQRTDHRHRDGQRSKCARYRALPFTAETNPTRRSPVINLAPLKPRASVLLMNKCQLSASSSFMPSNTASTYLCRPCRRRWRPGCSRSPRCHPSSAVPHTVHEQVCVLLFQGPAPPFVDLSVHSLELVAQDLQGNTVAPQQLVDVIDLPEAHRPGACRSVPPRHFPHDAGNV